MNDTISRTDAIKAMADAIWHYPNECYQNLNDYGIAKELACAGLRSVPSAQPEPLSDAYMNAVWTWLIDYQIKAAELKGRYTPYEVLSWVANDWRKEHERSDRTAEGD